MPAPTPTARQTPTGQKMDDGFSTKITFAADPDVALWEKSITPPGLDGGDPIDTTTMFNTDLRTKALRQLMEMKESSFTAAYRAGTLPQLIALINVLTVITLTFPNGKTWAFWGGLTKFEPGPLEEGTFPEATCTIAPTNEDTAGNEQLPAYGT